MIACVALTCYSGGMNAEISTRAPVLEKHGRSGNFASYPDPQTRLGKAWTAVWTELRAAELHEAGTYVAGATLADKVAPGVGLVEVTILGLLSRMTTAGFLEAERRPVPGKRGPRMRSFYRIKR